MEGLNIYAVRSPCKTATGHTLTCSRLAVLKASSFSTDRIRIPCLTFPVFEPMTAVKNKQTHVPVLGGSYLDPSLVEVLAIEWIRYHTTRPSISIRALFAAV